MKRMMTAIVVTALLVAVARPASAQDDSRRQLGDLLRSLVQRLGGEREAAAEAEPAPSRREVRRTSQAAQAPPQLEAPPVELPPGLEQDRTFDGPILPDANADGGYRAPPRPEVRRRQPLESYGVFRPNELPANQPQSLPLEPDVLPPPPGETAPQPRVIERVPRQVVIPANVPRWVRKTSEYVHQLQRKVAVLQAELSHVRHPLAYTMQNKAAEIAVLASKIEVLAFEGAPRRGLERHGRQLEDLGEFLLDCADDFEDRTEDHPGLHRHARAIVNLAEDIADLSEDIADKID